MINFREISARLAFPIIMGLGLWTTYYFIHLAGFAINKVTVGQLKAPFQGEVDKPTDFYERESYYHDLVKNG